MVNMLGRLNWEAFQHDPITMGGIIGGALAVLGVIVAMTYFKKWGWLWREWLTSLDPKKIGVMYIFVATLMLVRGFSDALMMRAQQILSVGDSHGILDTNTYQQVFTAHGTIMIFFVAMGLMFGLINLVLPLQIGARDVAFPFLNSVSFWLFVAGVILTNLSLAVGEFAATGWLAYPPLSGIALSPGVGVDYWIWALQIAGVGSLLSGLNFLVTIFRMRAPGMNFMKMPVFVWSVLVSMVLVIFTFPILTATLFMLSLDRLLGMHFFTADFGGNAMMYVNLIWAWGHPEVYILVLPAFGIFSEVVATFSKKRLFGYTSMVWALSAISFFSFIVWLHHFFTMGAGGNVNAFFGITTMIIAIPTGVKIFNWLFTMFRGRITFSVPLLWFLGFVLIFTTGGMTGVLLSIPAIDFQVHNSLFLVAHFHSMVIGGVVFGYIAGYTYWFPKIFGFKLNERLGRYAFYCWTIGFLLAFMPLYVLGLMGATRRLDHYDPSMGWQGLFMVSAVGACVIGLGIAFLILQLIYSIYKRKENLDTTGDPWDGRTLEWSTLSPAPAYNFIHIPQITDRDQFWAMKKSKNREAPTFEDIYLPKNTGHGIFIGGFALMIGFAIVWHIWWLAIVGLVGIISTLIVRSYQQEGEFVIKASQVAKLEAAHSVRKKSA